ncbi:glycosyltransferase [Nodosilinea sp. LEGE 06152]|uniref:glycosyltransferase n=1 Tax=Nodosilinea sp. LEGE 06152 TaxID=2777966 RepID=UPI0018826FED|nr:glycosyltransferase [Nodosilinea sp. LEGE 06152]MBE9157723.1 glycosyltransferase [Nodosilinea sp. LEGE 06152]
MRIVIDLQGAQSTASHGRGIERYSLAISQAIIQNRRDHEVIIVLNGHFPETIEPIRGVFDSLLPQDNIRVWDAVEPTNENHLDEQWRLQAAELIREVFIANLNPDVIYITSLFEGFIDNAITKVRCKFRKIPTVVTLFDLIPLVREDLYLKDSLMRNWYFNKVEELKSADLCLSISEASRTECIERLNFEPTKIVNVSTAADRQFKSKQLSEEIVNGIRERYSLDKPFILYTGGIDYRKNIEGLIRAFAILPDSIRDSHQLAIVCSIQPESKVRLENLIKQNRVKLNAVVFTGYVSEDDLINLYNLCRVFVFPSLHEGFGLPALEAMMCGAPVIASNTSSLPEVVGLEAALFDPFDDKAIATKISQVLTDTNFREELIEHSLKQAQRFSWDETGKKAVLALEKLVYENPTFTQNETETKSLLKLAYLSPLPPERSGISDYSAELLCELSKYYEIEVIVSQKNVSDPWVLESLAIRDINWFTQNFCSYDRVLYHFGNSEFHGHMFDLLENFPGVVVLHDFFLSGIQAHREVTKAGVGRWVQELYYSHGYNAVKSRFHSKDSADVVYKYPCNFSVLKDSLGIITHSEFSSGLAQCWYGSSIIKGWSVIPLLRAPVQKSEHYLKKLKLGFSADDFVVSCFGVLGKIKQNHCLLQAWLASALSDDKNCHLVFVGEIQSDSYSNSLLKRINESGLRNRIHITGWVDRQTFQDYLNLSDLAVQLRTLSRGETSAAVLDCMNHGIPTIVNAHGSMAEIPRDAVWMLEDEFNESELKNAIETLWKNSNLRGEIASRAQEVVSHNHSPEMCAKKYYETIERFYLDAKVSRYSLIDSIAQLDISTLPKHNLFFIAESISQSLPSKKSARQLFVDISELVQQDAKTGIQRVTRSILSELLLNPPPQYRVEPVYSTIGDRGYRYARNFTMRFLKCPQEILCDELIEFQVGDVFLGLDLQPFVIPAQASYLKTLYRRGIKIHFVVYDLLPVKLSNCFPKGAEEVYKNWLLTITMFNNPVCISRSVSHDLINWQEAFGEKRCLPFDVSSFSLGADISKSAPTLGLPTNFKEIIQCLKSRKTFLMVGTIEPRKNHPFVLNAFETLWNQGLEVNLVIVGKQGWLMETFVSLLSSHSKLNTHLFWLKEVSDEFLEKIYCESSALIAASEDEGYGLPIIEAARHGLPLIANDIPVFREVAGENAYYFSKGTPESLAHLIQEWLEVFDANPDSLSPGGISFISWEQSAKQLLEAIGIGTTMT